MNFLESNFLVNNVKMNAPKVSVIVPAYNAGETLYGSVGSLLRQALGELEIIIVDDGSTDQTRAVIERLATENSNVVPVYLAVNKGVHEARLAGLSNATASWIGFMDADDYVRPNMYSCLLSAAIDNEVDIVVCGADRVTAERKLISPKYQFPRSRKIEADVFNKFCNFEFGTGSLCNKLYRREVIEPWFGLHFPWRQSINEDLILNIGCFYNAKSVYLLKDRLYEYVLAEGSVTTEMKKCWAYSEMFRAYALAVTSYQSLGDKAVKYISDMYRTQLSWDSYQVDSVSELDRYSDKIKETVDYLYQKNAFAFFAIAARKPQRLVGARLALVSIFQAMKLKVRAFLSKNLRWFG
ncbi:MAG: glycosyltransferase family 2 protein [Pseudomonadota bacterium]